MAHYAFIDDANVVLEVIVGNDETTGDWESYYAAVRVMRCLRTSYNTQAGRRPDGSPGFRGNYAGIGFTFREDLDAFVPPCPGEGWVLDETTATWVPPQ
jgi:hypothetical protein